jgi:hypothetical protein
LVKRADVEAAGMCGYAGPSVWRNRGLLEPTLCMLARDHGGSHEFRSAALVGEGVQRQQREGVEQRWFRQENLP